MFDEDENKYVIRQGDCLTSIAAKTGFFWETIWNHSENFQLKNLRKDPNILFPGDVLTIPPFELKEVSGATEQRHTFVKKGEPAKLRLRFLENDEPRSDEEYILRIDGRFQRGKLDSDGRLETKIPPTASRVEVIFEDEEPILVQLGTVDPITEISGVQGRLNNLGFNAGHVDNKYGPKTLVALQRFQKKHKLEITGEIDEATKNKLVEKHGC